MKNLKLILIAASISALLCSCEVNSVTDPTPVPTHSPSPTTEIMDEQNPVSDVTEGVGEAVGDITEGTGEAISDVTEGIGDAAGDITHGVSEAMDNNNNNNQ